MRVDEEETRERIGLSFVGIFGAVMIPNERREITSLYILERQQMNGFHRGIKRSTSKAVEDHVGNG